MPTSKTTEAYIIFITLTNQSLILALNEPASGHEFKRTLSMLFNSYSLHHKPKSCLCASNSCPLNRIKRRTNIFYVAFFGNEQIEVCDVNGFKTTTN